MRPSSLSSTLFCLLVPLATLAPAAPSRETAKPPTARLAKAPAPVDHASIEILAKSATDSFYVYGGPGTLEGKFQNAEGVLPDDQGWFGVDRTFTPPKWHVSEFNAATLGGHGAGNHALWCGEPATVLPGWATPPGYGNSWDQSVVFTSEPVSDPSKGQTVELDFYFHHESEPGYDYFLVEYARDGQWQQIYAVDDTDADASGIFLAPGLRFAEVAADSIVYSGGDYADGDRVRLRLRFESDGGWSDEDGLWPTTAGAVQVDDIALTWSDGAQFWDMESGWPEPWRRTVLYAGDFADVYPSLPNADPCHQNRGPALAFVDAGQDVCPEGVELFDPEAPCFTGGSLAPEIVDPTFPWAVNTTGGLSDGELAVWSEFWSPPVDWDLPGTADDHPDMIGAKLAFDVYRDLPFQDNVFYVWHVRSRVAGGIWSPWRDLNFVYHGTDRPEWVRNEFDVTGLLEPGLDQLQIALGVRDGQDLFWTPGAVANSSPHFDNVALLKYQVGGPKISANDYHLAQDGFPVSGGLDASTPTSRDELDVPFDMAGDIGRFNPTVDSGDSVVVEVETIVPGSQVTDLRMVWILDKNPLFEDAIRSLPNRPQDENVVGGALQWSGEVLGDSARFEGQWLREGYFYFDLPDVDFLYPGDVIRYYIQATDDGGRISTLPSNTVGFATGEDYSRRFTVRALPSLADAGGGQPSRLVIDQFGHGNGEPELVLALAQMGLREGVDYDTYSIKDEFDAGIASAGGHGATVEQLAGYRSIYYFADREQWNVLTDGCCGSDEKYDDAGTLSAWHDLPGPRNMAHMGDSFAIAVARQGGASSSAYLRDVMGVDVIGVDVSPAIDGQASPVVEGLHPNFPSAVVSFGGCLEFRQFDDLRPRGGATRGHGFTAPGGGVYPDPAASVVHDRLVNGDRKIDITFAFSAASVRTRMLKGLGNPTQLSRLLAEVDAYFGDPAAGAPTSAPDAARVTPALSAHPSPFNPSTTVELVAPATEEARVEVFDLRGRRVRELFRGPLKQSGLHRMPWNGLDDRGAAVSSGVYFVRAMAAEFRVGTRVVLLK